MTGVCVRWGGPAALELHACTLSVFKSKLEFGEKHTGLKNILHFSKQYGAGIVALSLLGKGVLTRKIEQPGPAAAVLQKILPNVNPEEFYVQFHQDGGGHYVSLLRRAEADQLIAEFESYGFRVVSLNLAGFAASGILRPEVMDEALRPAYDAAFQVLLLGDEAVEVEDQVLHYTKQQAFARLKLLRTARLAGISMVFLLLLNFMLHRYYAGQAAQLSARNRVSGAAAGQLRATEAAMFQKTALIRSVGWMAGLNPAFLSDRLFAVLPGGVRVQEFSLNPVRKGDGHGSQEPVYQNGLIEVTGSCAEAEDLNSWLLAVKAFSWVKDCSIRNYLVSAESGLGIFTVHIQLKEDEE